MDFEFDYDVPVTADHGSFTPVYEPDTAEYLAEVFENGL
jgi:hypothetical protein